MGTARGDASHKISAYGKAAWAIEYTNQNLGVIYRQMGRKGLESIDNVGARLAGVIEGLIEAAAPLS